MNVADRASRPAHGRIERQPRSLAVTAAGALAVGGFVHLCLYRHGYRSIPVIGTMFAANVAVSAAAALAVLLRRELIVRLAGMAVAAGTLVAFGVSRTPAGLFNFQERGLRPAPQAPVALVAELVALTALAATLAWDVAAGRPWPARAAPAAPAAHAGSDDFEDTVPS